MIVSNDQVRVSILGPGITTVAPGIINRLVPGDQAIVEVGVQLAAGTTPGSSGTAVAKLTGKNIPTSTQTFTATFGIAQYTETYTSIYNHEAPRWYKQAKYGIFIHWGVYSVPGWGGGPGEEVYAEWYWNNYHSTGSPTGVYNKQTYGIDHEYDSFVSNFTASVWNPRGWVDLFAAAGARYFVPTSKHHDGWSLFDQPSTVSNRTTVRYGPKRDLIKELYAAASQYQPSLRKGVYYSLPEWYNPAYKPYAFLAWPGGPPYNPYTNQQVPYVGYVPVDDYLTDIQLPQMQGLEALGAELMWCDAGGANLTVEFAAAFFNNAAAKGKQVSLNNRCGLPGDFDTPEYATYDAIQPRKWESNLGMDPDSYGYNRATPLSSYKSASSIVTSLLDVVSKNGNFLLDVGPTANGTIIAVEQDNLQQAGVWINSHEEAIFNTTYWYITPEEGNLRFTQTANAFYIISLQPPSTPLKINSPVPYVAGDKVTDVGGSMNGQTVASSLNNGVLTLDVTTAIVNADQYSWVFKILFGGANPMYG